MLLHSLLSQVNLRQSDRTCRTVWELWPHSHLLLFANLRANKKAHRPIFPVLICVIRADSAFLIPLCSCRALVPGLGCVTESIDMSPSCDFKRRSEPNPLRAVKCFSIIVMPDIAD